MSQPHATGKPVLWQALTWPEIAELRAGGQDLVILPVGATEQHGPHLVTGTDTLSAELVAHAVSAGTGVPVLPALAYGSSLGHSHRWPGTLSLSPATLTQTVIDLYAWLNRAGFTRLYIINGHVTNFAPLRCALEMIRATYDNAMIALRSLAEISPRVREIYYADAADWHANQAETALLLSQAPAAVRPDLCAGSDDTDRTEGIPFAFPVNRTSANGVTGYPSRATAGQGSELFSMLVEDFAADIRRALAAQFPFPRAGYGHL